MAVPEVEGGLEKDAFRVCVGHNHRFNMSDGVLIKDNHIAAAGGIASAVSAVRNTVPHVMKIEVETETLDEVRQALEAGAEDIEVDEDEILVITTPESFGDVQDALTAAGLKSDNAEVVMSPSTKAEITDIDQAKKIMKMIDMLEDLDDVQNVYTNVEFSDAVLAELDA